MNKSTVLLYRILGMLTGILGIEHGVGELLLGNKTIENLFFLSWPNNRFFEIMAGEPALSIIHNYLFTGILAILLSIIFVLTIWVLKPGKLQVLIQFFIVTMMILLGAGFGPPLLGIFVIPIGVKRNSEHRAMKKISFQILKALSIFWPFSFGACMFSWFMVFPGASLISLTGISDSRLLLIPTAAAFLLIPITYFLGVCKDLTSKKLI